MEVGKRLSDWYVGIQQNLGLDKFQLFRILCNVIISQLLRIPLQLKPMPCFVSRVGEQIYYPDCITRLATSNPRVLF